MKVMFPAPASGEAAVAQNRNGLQEFPWIRAASALSGVRLTSLSSTGIGAQPRTARVITAANRPGAGAQAIRNALALLPEAAMRGEPDSAAGPAVPALAGTVCERMLRVEPRSP